ncbi:MAG: hypothetical protein JO190_08060 [Candidatus Eremiobacteraeota bacterium]|nr:hypothetical protein [Candidatus Eremiobacteraeota bacterium]MBV8499582.1 hypothetical protein [Candidatus Eremiobacteraeota bacterium]
MIGQAVSLVLGNSFIPLFAIAVVMTIVKLRRFKLEHRPVNAAYVFWGEVLFYNVGIGFVLVGIFHAYFPQIAAPSIGWTPSPFEYELGWIEIALGLVAIMALWRGYEFRLAATIVFAIFALAAAAGHIQQIQCCHNYAPGNAGLTLWFGDIFVPVVIVVAAALCRGERS